MEVERLPDEIIVVNDGGDRGLKDKIKDIPRRCPIVYADVHEDIPWNYNGACNLAVWLSRGDFLAFEDNDNVPSLTFYKEALAYFESNPKIARVQATKRKTISLDDFLNKPRGEWIQIGQEGANMGTAVIPRNIYLSLKGHDERFCGRYGWMYYDFRSRCLRLQGGMVDYTASVGEYFYTKEGQSNLERDMSTQNLAYYRENAHHGRTQPPQGVLNFTYSYEILPRNTK